MSNEQHPSSPQSLPQLRLPLAPDHAPPAAAGIPASVAARHPADGWHLAEPFPLGRGSIRRFRALVKALLPPAPAPSIPGIETRIVDHVRRMMRYMPRPVARLGIPFLLLALEWSPFWSRGRLRRLSSLAPGDAAQVLTGVAESRHLLVRMLMLAPKALVLSTYFDQDDVHRALNYEPRSFFAERIALRTRLHPPANDGAVIPTEAVPGATAEPANDGAPRAAGAAR